MAPGALETGTVRFCGRCQVSWRLFVTASAVPCEPGPRSSRLFPRLPADVDRESDTGSTASAEAAPVTPSPRPGAPPTRNSIEPLFDTWLPCSHEVPLLQRTIRRQPEHRARDSRVAWKPLAPTPSGGGLRQVQQLLRPQGRSTLSELAGDQVAQAQPRGSEQTREGAHDESARSWPRARHDVRADPHHSTVHHIRQCVSGDALAHVGHPEVTSHRGCCRTSTPAIDFTLPCQSRTRVHSDTT